MTTKRKIAFSSIAVAAILLAVEGLCRLFALAPPRPAVDAAISDWHETPDGNLFWVARGPEFNADGMRDREHDLMAAAGVRRIVCLGDSVTLGFRTARHQTYPFLFEEYLRQLGLSVEVFNVAQSGWSTRQQLEAYRRIVRTYRPAHLFLGFCLNDVAEMNNNLLRRPPRMLGAAARHSALVRWIAGAERRQVRRVEDLFADPPARGVREGWESVFADLITLRNEAAADGCDLSVLIFPFRFQLGADAPPPRAQRTLTDFCLRHGIPALDLLPALTAAGAEAFLDDSHLSPIGARVVAEELIRWGRSGCTMCGHDLAGWDGPACPECGTRIER